jgi:hypothetical protein
MGSARGGRDSARQQFTHERNEALSASLLRRIAVIALAAAGLTAVAAPAAGASTMEISTSQSVVAPYDASALYGSRYVYEGRGPVMLRIRHTMKCKRGDYHRARPYPICNWNSSMDSKTASVSTTQGVGDAYPVRTNLYPAGATYHWGTMAQGQVRTDEWLIVVRNDDVREIDETFNMRVRSLNRTFTIVDDDSRR